MEPEQTASPSSTPAILYGLYKLGSRLVWATGQLGPRGVKHVVVLVPYSTQELERSRPRLLALDGGASKSRPYDRRGVMYRPSFHEQVVRMDKLEAA